MKKRVMWWAILGFVIPVFWGVVSFIFFSAKESIWTDVYWRVVYVTCPFWLLPSNTTTTVMTPFLNAILYGGLAFLLLSTRNARSKSANPSA